MPLHFKHKTPDGGVYVHNVSGRRLRILLEQR